MRFFIMSNALYRKYRPQAFADLVGQNPIRITLENEIANDRIAHAYLFSGPRGVGKTTTARLLAKAVNCTNRHGAEPCGSCDSCKEVAAGRAMDLIEIDAASHTGVDNVRENIIENARFTPQRAAYKVFIIDEVHMLSLSAFNALLKTLEEPPAHVIFILATTEIHRVPETIISRCQRFDFKRVGISDLDKRLHHLAKQEGVTIEESIVKNIAYRAEGSVRDAEVLLTQIMALGEKHITEEEASLVIPRSNAHLTIELFRYLVQHNASAGIALINKLVDEGVNLPDFTQEFIELLRKLLLFKVSGSLGELAASELDETTMNEVQSQVELISQRELLTMVELFSAKSRDLRYASIIQLPLELAVIELCEPHQGETPGNNKPPSPPQASVPPVQKTKTPASAPKKSATKAVLFDELNAAWGKIVTEVRQQNQSLGLSLKVGLPTSVTGDKLTIGFRYKFHTERIKERKTLSIIEDAVEKVTGKKLKVSVSTLSEDEFDTMSKAQPASQPAAGAWQSTLQVFGSEIIK